MRLMAMATSNTQKTIVSLNSKLALDELQKLKKQVEDLKKKRRCLEKNNDSWSKQDAKKNQTAVFPIGKRFLIRVKIIPFLNS